MNRITLFDWELEIDPEGTKRFFSNIPSIAQSCGCLYCCNFVEAAAELEQPISDIFSALGIAPSKCGHISEFGQSDGGMRLYGGSYHLVGKVKKGKLCTSFDWNDNNTVKIGRLTFGFSEELMFVPDGFPSPVIQLEFTIDMPWVLSEFPED